MRHSSRRPLEKLHLCCCNDNLKFNFSNRNQILKSPIAFHFYPSFFMFIFPFIVAIIQRRHQNIWTEQKMATTFKERLQLPENVPQRLRVAGQSTKTMAKTLQQLFFSNMQQFFRFSSGYGLVEFWMPYMQLYNLFSDRGYTLSCLVKYTFEGVVSLKWLARNNDNYIMYTDQISILLKK